MMLCSGPIMKRMFRFIFLKLQYSFFRYNQFKLFLYIFFAAVTQRDATAEVYKAVVAMESYLWKKVTIMLWFMQQLCYFDHLCLMYTFPSLTTLYSFNIVLFYTIQGKAFHLWSKRYYLISGNCMYYYTNKDDVRPKGKLYNILRGHNKMAGFGEFTLLLNSTGQYTILVTVVYSLCSLCTLSTISK